MLYLDKATITCDDQRTVTELKERFGRLYYGNSSPTSNTHTLHLRVFKNNIVYGGVNGEGKPLFVLVPSEDINAVWPDQIKDCGFVRFGTSGDGKKVTPLLSIQLRDGVGLLFCLTPGGIKLQEENSFGV